MSTPGRSSTPSPSPLVSATTTSSAWRQACVIDARRVQGPDQLLRDTHRRREALRQAMADLEAAIAKPVPGRAKEWSATVTRALGGIGTALREHVAANECDDGLFDQVIETQPR